LCRWTSSKEPNTAIAMRNVRHIMLAAVLFGAPFLACSSATSPTTSDAGVGGGQAKFRMCLGGACDQAQSDTYAACLHAKCDGQYAKCYGADYKIGTFEGAPCSDVQACDQKCACGDTKCREACAITGECVKCLYGELSECLRGADASCTIPACSNQDGGGGGTDGGGGGVDSGGGKPNCTALAACCAKLPDPAKSKCTDLVDRDDDVYCGNSRNTYCSLDPSACTKLTACCATLSGSDKTTCELQVSTYGTDVELCGVALKSYPTCD